MVGAVLAGWVFHWALLAVLVGMAGFEAREERTDLLRSFESFVMMCGKSPKTGFSAAQERTL